MRFALSAIGALALAVAVPGQVKFEVGPDALTAGGQANVSYKDPSRAGQTVLVEIENSDPLNPLYDYVLIELDASGEGSGDWDVPEGGWGSARFLAPAAPPKTFPVNPTPQPTPGPTPVTSATVIE